MQSGVQGGGVQEYFKRGAKKGCKGDARTFKGVREVRTTLKVPEYAPYYWVVLQMAQNEVFLALHD